MSKRQLFNTVHKWTGRLSAIPALVVCLTGVLYVFRTEITNALVSNDFNKTVIDSAFGFIIDGHQFLWLPDAVGRIVVGGFVAVFTFSLMIGMGEWFPKIIQLWRHRRGTPISTIIHIHALSGLILSLPLLLLCLTGLIYAFYSCDNQVVMRVVAQIHRGQFCGAAGQLLMLFASLTGVVLTVTGLIIWYRLRAIGGKKK